MGGSLLPFSIIKGGGVYVFLQGLLGLTFLFIFCEYVMSKTIILTLQPPLLFLYNLHLLLLLKRSENIQREPECPAPGEQEMLVSLDYVKQWAQRRYWHIRKR